MRGQSYLLIEPGCKSIFWIHDLYYSHYSMQKEMEINCDNKWKSKDTDFANLILSMNESWLWNKKEVVIIRYGKICLRRPKKKTYFNHKDHKIIIRISSQRVQNSADSTSGFMSSLQCRAIHKQASKNAILKKSNNYWIPSMLHILELLHMSVDFIYMTTLLKIYSIWWSIIDSMSSLNNTMRVICINIPCILEYIFCSS